MSGLKHITQETFDFIVGDSKDSFVGVSYLHRPYGKSEFFAPCGWGGSDTTWEVEKSNREGFTAIDVETKNIMRGFGKVTCPKCIEALKKRGF